MPKRRTADYRARFEHTSLPGNGQAFLCPAIQKSAVTFPHHEVQRAQNGGHVADHVAGEKFGADAEIHERRGTNLEPIGYAAAFAVDVESEFALWIFVPEI